jgi:hypothetical protein
MLISEDCIPFIFISSNLKRCIFPSVEDAGVVLSFQFLEETMFPNMRFTNTYNCENMDKFLVMDMLLGRVSKRGNTFFEISKKCICLNARCIETRKKLIYEDPSTLT